MGLFTIIEPGMLTTVQDLGRPGFSALGLCHGGAADALAFRMGNRIVGNPDNTPGLEMTLIGPTIRFDADCIIALTGGELPDFRTNTPLHFRAGSQLRIGPFQSHARRYLCIRGGIQVPTLLNSASTHLGASFGGYHGRALRVGDQLSFADSPLNISHAPPCVPVPLPVPGRTHILRATSGMHRSKFPDSAADLFWTSAFTVSNQSNRVGIRLEGPAISSTISGRMVSAGMPPGAVQIPENGMPIILGVDHPTTGGYPVIACVATVDVHLLGQLRPGAFLQFRLISLDEARQALHDRNHAFESGATLS